jgi:hypothetical protein
MLAVVGVCLMLSIAIGASSQGGGNTQDEGLLLEYPMLVIQGKLPFSDYQSSYGIGTYLPLAGAYKVLGPSVSVERTIGVAYMLAVVLAIMALLASLGTPVQLIGGSLAAVGIVGPGPPVAYGWYASLACTLWAVWLARCAALDRRRRPGLIWAASGLLSGLAISVRPELGLPACLLLLMLVLSRRRASLRAFFLGAAVGVIPLVVDLVIAGPAAVWTYLVLARLHTLPESGQKFTAQTASLTGVLIAAAVLLLIVAVRELRRKGANPMTLSWLALAGLSAVILGQAVQRPDSGHLAYVAPVIVGLLPWAANTVVRLRATAGAIIALVCATAVLFHVSAEHRTGYPVRNEGRSFPVSSAAGRDQLQVVLRYLDRHTRQGERLFVGPQDFRWALWDDTVIYYLTPQLSPSSFYLELGPGDNAPRFTSTEMRGLRRSQVLVLDDSPTEAGRLVYPYAVPGSSAPNALIRREFRVAMRAGPYSVWLRRPRA